MTSLLETFKLAFLSNIIKNKHKGNAQPVSLGDKRGDELMQVLVNDVFKKLLDEKKVTTIQLTQYYNRDILPITTNFVAKFSKTNDVLFNRISLMRLLSVCNLFLQDNNVGTLKRVRKKVDYEPDHAMIELLQNMQISRGNQDVVEAIEKQQISTIDQLNSNKSGIEAAIKTASAERKKEAADLKEDLKKYIEEMIKLQTSNKRIKDADEEFDHKTSSELEAETKQYSKNVKDKNKVENQFNDNVTAVTFNRGQYIVTLNDETKLFTIHQFDNLSNDDQEYLETFLKRNNIDPTLIEQVDALYKELDDVYTETFDLRSTKPNAETLISLELKYKKLIEQLKQKSPFRTEIKKKQIKYSRLQRNFFRGKSNISIDKDNNNLASTNYSMKEQDYYSFDEYSDDFEAASNDMSIAETHFLKVIFDTLGMTGIESVTDALINYLNSGLQINKRKYKDYYKEFYQKWQFQDDIMMERDKDVVKTLFADAPIDFDDDYLNIIGGDIKMNWISHMRIAVYEKYILMDFIQNFKDYDIRGCIKEALNNFIYDHCYMSTLMFQNVSE